MPATRFFSFYSLFWNSTKYQRYTHSLILCEWFIFLVCRFNLIWDFTLSPKCCLCFISIFFSFLCFALLLFLFSVLRFFIKRKKATRYFFSIFFLSHTIVLCISMNEACASCPWRDILCLNIFIYISLEVVDLFI